MMYPPSVRWSSVGALALTLLITTSATAGWLPLDGGVSERPPEITIVSETADQLQLSILIPGMTAHDRATPTGAESWLEIPGHGHTMIEGAPAVPVVRLLAEVPLGASVEAQATAGGSVSYAMGEGILRDRLFPMQPPQPKSRPREDLSSFVRDADAYAQSGTYPAGLVEVEEAGIVRGRRLVLVEIHPVAYDAAAGMLTAMEQVDVTLHLPGSDMEATWAAAARGYSAPFEALLEQITVNHRNVMDGDREILPLPLGVLIITPDVFEAQLEPLVEWKKLKGYHPYVATLSETGSTKEQITAYIENAYTNWELPPTWVLLIGDTNLIPCYTGYSCHTASDLYFGAIEGADYFPDIYPGRLPVRDATQLEYAVEKLVDYEKIQLANGVDFMNRATWIASSDQGAMAEDTHNYVIEHYFPEEMEHTKIYERLGGSSQDIRDALAAGTVIMNYSGHGNESGWACIPFGIGDVRNGGNVDAWPFVISNACLTGDYAVTECFGESWILDDQGGIAHLGCSNSSYWTEDDIYEKELWKAFWRGECYDLGQLNAEGLFGLYQYLGGGGRSRYYYESYNIMGDAATDLWATLPDPIAVDHLDVFRMDWDEFTVTVTEDGDPSLSALVCLYMEDEVYETGYTDASGVAVIPVDPGPQHVGTLYVTVTKHDREPYFGSAAVLPANGPVILFESFAVDDDAAGGSLGNDDAGADCGETIELSVVLHNYGVDPASGVTATLTSDDPYIAILDGTETFGTIPAETSVACAEDFDVRISGICPDGHVIHCTLDVTDDQRQLWDCSFDVTVDAPTLVVSGTLIDDSVGGDGDGRAEAGESFAYHVWLTNAGGETASSVDVTLLSGDPNVTVLQEGAGIGSLAPGQQVELSPAFELSVEAGSAQFGEYPLYFQALAEWGYREDLTDDLVVGGFADDVEAGEGSWSHHAETNGFVDQWHRSSQRNHSDGGSWAWKQGATTAGGYAGYCDGCLESDVLPLDEGGTIFRFWHWMDAEIHASFDGFCWDGGIIELSINGGAWEQVTPEPAYTHQIINSSDMGPFPGNTWVYSGSFDWTEAQIELTGLSGTAQFRLRFGSNSDGTAEGWFVDDLQYSGPPVLQDAERDWHAVALHPVLSQNAPNPFARGTVVAFQLPRSQAVKLEVYDTAGRLIRTLADGLHEPGAHRLGWDGQSNRGERMPSGVYYYRLSTDNGTLTRSMRLLR